MTTRRNFFKTTGAAGLASLAPLGGAKPIDRAKRPNIVLIFMDDQGFGDAGCYGATGYETPNIDRLAAEGARFTDFYAPACVCSPSRAGLMTGCYPVRVGIPGVLGPGSSNGISAEETTLAELLKPLGYATACYGKWHLGHHKEFLPTRHGFDEYFGLPYSNDMWPFHPTAGAKFPPLPLIDGEKIIEYNPDQTKLTTWYTERSVDFIDRNAEQPFFLYLPHSMVHVPLFVSDKFKGKSGRGLFGDVMMEIDWSVGEILKALKRNGVDRDTLVIFTSDNGPWLEYGDHAGSSGPLRAGKHTTFDGGTRVMGLMRWPARIPKGLVVDQLASNMDVFATAAAITGAPLPERKIDGKNILPLMTGEPGAKTPHRVLYSYKASGLEAVRSGKWKLHVSHSYGALPDGVAPATGGMPVKFEKRKFPGALYDLQSDIGETSDLSAENPEVVARLEKLLDAMRKDLGDSFTKASGANRRPAGKVDVAASKKKA